MKKSVQDRKAAEQVLERDRLAKEADEAAERAAEASTKSVALQDEIKEEAEAISGIMEARTSFESGMEALSLEVERLEETLGGVVGNPVGNPVGIPVGNLSEAESSNDMDIDESLLPLTSGCMQKEEPGEAMMQTHHLMRRLSLRVDRVLQHVGDGTRGQHTTAQLVNEDEEASGLTSPLGKATMVHLRNLSRHVLLMLTEMDKDVSGTG